MVRAPAPILPQKRRLRRQRWGEKLPHSVPGHTLGFFPVVGFPFSLKCAIQTLQKTQQVLSTPAGSEGLSIPAGCPNHEHRLVLVSFSSSLFIPLSSPRLKSEPHSPIGHVAWSCDWGAKTQNLKCACRIHLLATERRKEEGACKQQEQRHVAVSLQ